MPFTASHPAIILPLLKSRWFSASGLIMGSMVPDFEFFMRLNGHRIHGHTILGMFWFNVPVAIVFIFFYHLWIRDAMIDNLPKYFRDRFKSFSVFDFTAFFKANYIKVIYSIIIGNISHIAWDAFTHIDGYFVFQYPILRTPIHLIPFYELLQYGCSALSAIYMLVFISKLPKRKSSYQILTTRQLSYWLLVCIVTFTVCFLRLRTVESFVLGEFLVVFISGFMVGLSVASITDFQLQKKRVFKVS